MDPCRPKLPAAEPSISREMTVASSSSSESSSSSDSSSDSSSSSSSDDSSDSESGQDGREGPCAVEKYLARRRAAIESAGDCHNPKAGQVLERQEEGFAGNESALQSPNEEAPAAPEVSSKAETAAIVAAFMRGASSSSGSESEGSQEQEGGEPVPTTPSPQTPFGGVDNHPSGAAEGEGIKVKGLEGAEMEAAPLPTRHASPAVPILGCLAGEATAEATASLAAAPFVLQEGLTAYQEASMAASQPADTALAEAESAPSRSASPKKVRTPGWLTSPTTILVVL